MRSWSSRSCLLACLGLVGCPSSDPAPSNDSSSGSTAAAPTTTNTNNDSTGTTPPPASTGSQSSGAVDSTSTGPGPGTTSSDTTGPGTSTGAASTGDGSSSGEAGSSSGGMNVDCSAGDGPDFVVANMGFGAYIIDGVNNDSLTVVRGCEYTFTIATPGHPFLIKTVQGTGMANSYGDGVNGNGTTNGVLTWNVAANAPGTLFYNCQFHAPMTGEFTVIDP